MESLIDKINHTTSNGLHFGSPLPSSRTNEFDLVILIIILLSHFVINSIVVVVVVRSEVCYRYFKGFQVVYFIGIQSENVMVRTGVYISPRPVFVWF